MKRAICLFAALLTLVCLTALPAFALEPTEYAPYAVPYTDLERAIYEGLGAKKTSIDLSSYNINTAKFEVAFEHVYHTAPELFFVDYDADMTVLTSGEQVQSFRPTYENMSVTEIEDGKTLVRNTIDEICAGADKANFTDFEKALYVHDYIVNRYSYDDTLTIRDAYRFFRDGKGVCASYAIVYTACLSELGIPVDVVSSASLEHIWNVVQLDGAWYHVDLTWDDPVSSNGLETVLHTNFLKSDPAFRTTHNSYDWQRYGVSSVNTRSIYDNTAWSEITGPFVSLNGIWYCVNNADDYAAAEIAAYDFTTDTASTVYSLGEVKWKVSTSAYYPANFTTLGTYKNVLYFNTDKAIFSLDLTTNTPTQIFSLASGNAYENIYCLRVSDNLAYYKTYTDLNAAPIQDETIQLVRRYDVRFLDSDAQTELFICQLDEGSEIPLPRYTEKTENYKIYPLKEWDGYTAGMTVTGNLDFIAVYDTENARDVQFTYTFYDSDGVTILFRATAPYGTLITPPEIPTKAADALWQYTFSAWSGYTEGMTLTKSVNFIATYTTTSNVVVPPLVPPMTSGNENPLTSPILWVAGALIVFAVLVPVLVVPAERRAERKAKRKNRKQSKNDSHTDAW